MVNIYVFQTLTHKQEQQQQKKPRMVKTKNKLNRVKIISPRATIAAQIHSRE